MADAAKPLEVFYSYSHRDEDLRDELDRHLSALKLQGVISGWHDRNIDAGTEWEQQISEHLDCADIILLLVSSYFLSSAYCVSKEMNRALERHASGEARVIPIVLRPVDWEDMEIRKLQALPTDAKPVSRWRDKHEAFANIAKGIRKASKEIREVRGRRAGKVWMVPYPQNRNFIGREELLNDLHVKLTSGQRAALTQAIHGLGGVGKTQIAIEYAYRYAGEYNAVLWMRAEEPTTLAADFAGLTTTLGLWEPDITDQDAAVKAVLRWLRENSKWLLVFDNAAEGKQIAKYLPHGGKGHVLITSRNRHWRQYAQPLGVEVMTSNEAIKFLLTQTGQTDAAAAGQLAEELGYLPLALAQASAYIDQKEKSLADYLPLVQQYRDRVLTPSEDYPTNLAATWELSFQAVGEHSQAATDLLNLCAFFAPEDIPLDMIVAGIKYLPDGLKNAVLEPLERDDIVGELGDYSLVEVDRDRYTLSVHRLVQAVVRDKLSSKDRMEWLEVALRVVESGFRYERADMSTWPIAALLLPHATAVITSPNLQEPVSREVSELLCGLLYQVGLYLRLRAQFRGARDHLARALTIGEDVYGNRHSTVARILTDLGVVLKDLGDLKGARSNLERALAIDEAVAGPNHPDAAISLNDLAGVLKDLGDLKGARSNLERALAIREASYGPDHRFVAITLNNLAGVLKDLGDLRGARANYERSLAISETVYGPDHPSVATALGNLGVVLQDLNDLKGARIKTERSLAISETVYGPDHPSVASRLNNLGSVLKDLGDLKGARSNVKRALAINEAVYGSDHPDTALILSNLGQIHFHEGDLPQAQACFDRAYRIFLKYLGPGHQRTRKTKKSVKVIRQLRRGRQA